MFLSGCAGNLLLGFVCPLLRAVEGVPPHVWGNQSCHSLGYKALGQEWASRGHWFPKSAKISMVLPIVRMCAVRGVGGWEGNNVIYNHLPGLPPRALLASLSCSENTAFKWSARLFCWKTTSTTLSLQVTWEQRKALYEGQVDHPPRYGLCMGCEPALINSDWTLPDDDKSRRPGWLASHRPPDPAFVHIGILVERVP